MGGGGGGGYGGGMGGGGGGGYGKWSTTVKACLLNYYLAANGLNAPMINSSPIYEII